MKNKKIISIVFLFLMIFQSFQTLFLNNVYAADANLYEAGRCGNHLQFNSNGSWNYVDNAMVYYRATNGKNYPAYCIDFGVQGIGDNGQTNQTVNVDNVMSDNRIWRIVTNSYPYKSLGELGVSCIEDAYIATRQAIYSVLLGRTVESTKAYFRGGDERGWQIYNLLVSLVDKGLNGKDVYQNAVGKLTKVSDLALNGNYYEVQYQVSGNHNIGNYNILIDGFPNGTTTEVLSNNLSKFKVKIPKDKLTSNIDGDIEMRITLRSCPVFYGKTYDSNLQNYAIAGDPYDEDRTWTTLSINTGVEVSGKKVANENNIWTGHKKGQGVAGATYEIRKKADNSLVTTVITGADGSFKTTLNPGTYTIKETKAPANFKVDQVTHEFTISSIFDKKTISLTEDVNKGGYFNLVKYSKDKSLQTGLNANSRLAGATFEIRKKADNSLIATITTNKNGTLDQDLRLGMGTYTIKEIKAPKGYKLDSTVKEFSLTNNEQKVTLDLYNLAIPFGTVNVTKKSSDNNLWNGIPSGGLVANATYEIRDLAGKVVSTFTTNANGASPTITLPTGTYTMKETKAPNAYYIDSKEYKINISKNLQNVSLNVSDTPVICGLFNLKKITNDDNLWTKDSKNNPLANATFVIRSDNAEIGDSKGTTGKFEKTVTTNVNGTLDQDLKLYKGDYTIEEIDAPNSYYIDKTIREFSITNNKQEIKLDFTNTPVVCGLFNFKKITNDDNLWTGDLINNPLANATYLIKSENYEIVDELGNASTTTFELEVTTNEYGTLDEDLMLHKGKYTIQEIKAPEGYYLDPNVYEFEVTDNKQEIKLDFNDTPVVCGLFNIKKITNDDNLWTKDLIKNALANATFVIRSDNAEIGDSIGTTAPFELYVTTNKDGTLDEDLMLYKGNYTIKEVKAPTGYYLDPKVYKFEINNNKQEIDLFLTNTPIVCGLFSFKKLATDDNLWTEHLKGDFLPNATYVIKSENYEIVDKLGNASTTTFELEVTTNKDGTLNQDVMLRKGKYTIQEIKAPEGYYLDPNVYEFEVKFNKQEIDLDLENIPIVCGLFNFKKISSNYNTWNEFAKGSPLANATYVIKSENYEIVDELGNASTTTFELEVTTNEYGTLDEDLMLHKGKYTIQEIKAPEYYLLDKNIYEFEITDNKQVIKFEFEDDSIDINIDIDKIGLIQTQANDEIRYNFNTFENNSNIPLDNFTWEDNLPYDSIKITKLFTGTYNYDLDYNVYYKTNKSEDYIKIGTYNTMSNHYIDMTKLNLEENEEITSFKINYGTVPEDFRAVVTPFIFAKVRSFIKNGDSWTNNTKLYGFYDSKKYVDKYNVIKDKSNVTQEDENIYRIEDKASWTTTAYSKKLNIKIHPKTGK